jgi:hypothetical protein
VCSTNNFSYWVQSLNVTAATAATPVEIRLYANTTNQWVGFTACGTKGY